MTKVPRPGAAPRVVFRGPSPAVRRSLATESAASILLLIGTVLALAWANSPWSAAYVDFWHQPVGFGSRRVTCGTGEPCWCRRSERSAAC